MPSSRASKSAAQRQPVPAWLGSWRGGRWGCADGYGLCLALTAALLGPGLRPLFDSAGDSVLRLPDNHDGIFLTWALAWDRAWLLGQGGPGRGLFDGPIFFPHRGALAYSEHALGLLPLFLALFPWFDSPSFAYHALMLLCFAFSGWSVFWLVRRVTRLTFPALTAAFLWLASTYHVADSERFLFHVVWGVPLMWIGLDGFARAGKSKQRRLESPRHGFRGVGWLALACAAALWQCLAAWYVAQHVAAVFCPKKH